ncbi:MAG: peptidoglycan bridge formation glycyltransferase FemA/FemB family protein [Nanoarchaeota archaeon]
MKDINATVIVNLDKSEDELFNSFRKQTRTGIRKAMKSGLTVEESNNWEEAYEVYKNTRDRNNIKIRSLEYLKSKTDKLFVCKKDGKVIAINLIWFLDLYDKNVPRTMTNSFLKEYAEYRPNELLYWHVFKYYRNLGYKKFDLGGWAIKSRENLDQVNKFKESFGEVVYFERDYPLLQAVGRKMVRNFGFFWNLNKAIKRKSDKDLFKENVDIYKSQEAVVHYATQMKMKEVEKDLIKKYFYGNVLDLGCGCGRTTKYISDQGFDVIGVDIVEDMIKKAREMFPNIKFETGDACSLNHEDDKFDIVFFSFNGLDYIYPESKRIMAVKEVARVLKKDGYFIYSSHNPLSLFFKFRPGLLWRSAKTGKIFSKYKPEKNINFGLLHTYFATPKNQIKLIESNTGLKFIEQVPNSAKELHPHYVFRKSKSL